MSRTDTTDQDVRVYRALAGADSTLYQLVTRSPAQLEGWVAEVVRRRGEWASSRTPTGTWRLLSTCCPAPGREGEAGLAKRTANYVLGTMLAENGFRCSPGWRRALGVGRPARPGFGAGILDEEADAAPQPGLPGGGG